MLLNTVIYFPEFDSALHLYDLPDMNCTSTKEEDSFKTKRLREHLLEDDAPAAEWGSGNSTTDSTCPELAKTTFEILGVSLTNYYQGEERQVDVVQLGQRPNVISGTAQSQILPQAQTKVDKIQELTCNICGRTHSSKRSLRRHLRSVHQPKAFRCSRCDSSFTRNDTLVRHVAEHHSGSNARIKCMSCGRHISERAFADHLDSQACKKTRTLVSQERFDGLEFGFPGKDDDAFLVTIRMFIHLKLSLSFRMGTQEPQLTSELFSRDGKGELSSKPEHSRTITHWNQLYGRALYLTRQQIERDFSAVYIFAALWCSALLLGLMSFARGLDEDAWAHFKGAEAALKMCHGSTCDCDSYDYCEKWRWPTIRDPTLALVGRVLEERGFTKARAPLLHVKMTEDDALRTICLHHFKMLAVFSSN